jgi:hypothetical protein
MRAFILLRGYSSGKNSARIRAALSGLHANELTEVLQILIYEHNINPAFKDLANIRVEPVLFY